MLKREIKRQLERYGKYLDILSTFVLLLLFIVPIISVLNLSPIPTSEVLSESPDDILGVEIDNDQPIQLKMVGGQHNYIQNEALYSYSDESFLYSTKLSPRDKGEYSKPIFDLFVPEGQTVRLVVSIGAATASGTQLGIMLGNTNYILRDNDGATYIRVFEIDSPGDHRFWFDVRNPVDINFYENIDLRVRLITVQGVDESLPEVEEIEENTQEIEMIEQDEYTDIDPTYRSANDPWLYDADSEEDLAKTFQ